MDDGDEDIPTLSGNALAALQEFYSERKDEEQHASNLTTAIENGEKLSMSMFREDWNASQFWYSDSTARILAEELLDGTTSETAIAVVSAPSTFIQVKNILNSASFAGPKPMIRLFEYDDRFGVMKEFIHYDYQKPLQIPAEYKGRFDYILCDPPFLSDECQTKAAMTVRWLSKSEGARIIVCTGERMEAVVHKVYPGTRTTTFLPEHAQGRLANEFRCYSNFESTAWKWC